MRASVLETIFEQGNSCATPPLQGCAVRLKRLASVVALRMFGQNTSLSHVHNFTNYDVPQGDMQNMGDTIFETQENGIVKDVGCIL